MVILGGVGVIEEGFRVAFYREVVTFQLVEVGGRSECQSNGGFDELKMKKSNTQQTLK